MAMLRVGKITSAAGTFPCRVRNLSSRGFMAQAATPPRQGDAVTLELREGERLQAVVGWVRQDKFGATFSKAHDLNSLVSGAPLAQGHQRRSARFQCEGMGTMRTPGQNHFVTVTNVSQTGICVALEGIVRAGEQVSCDIDGLGRVEGAVRWHRDGQAGISLNEPLAYDVLAHWIWVLSRGSPSEEAA